MHYAQSTANRQTDRQIDLMCYAQSTANRQTYRLDVLCRINREQIDRQTMYNYAQSTANTDLM